MTLAKPFHPELPQRLIEMQQVLQKCLRIMELGRFNDLYAFAWYEEKVSYAVEASRTVNTSANVAPPTTRHRALDLI